MYVLCHRRRQTMNTNKIKASRRHFLYHRILHYKIHRDSFSPVFHSVMQRKYRWCLYLLNLQYSLPDNLLYYITIQYFIFFVFFWFLYHSQAKYRGAYVVGTRVCRGEWDVWVKWAWKRCVQVFNHVGWNDPCAEGARARQWNSRLLDIPETIVALRSPTTDVPGFWAEVLLYAVAQQAGHAEKWCLSWFPE